MRKKNVVIGHRQKVVAMCSIQFCKFLRRIITIRNSRMTMRICQCDVVHYVVSDDNLGLEHREYLEAHGITVL